MAVRDGYSNLKFFQEVLPSAAIDATTTGTTVDMQGFNTGTIIVNVGRLSLISDASHWVLRLQHTDASALGAGPSDFADAAATDVIASDALTLSGIWKTLDLSTDGSAAYAVGYRGSKRYIHLVIEKVLTPSIAEFGSVAILGEPGDWAVQTNSI